MPTIKKTDHCQFCDHHKRDFQKGIYCGLTDEKPEFGKYCNKINLDHLFSKEIASINAKHYKLTSRKFDVIAGLILFPLIGVVILYGDYWFYHNYFKPYFLDAYTRSRVTAGSFAIVAILFTTGITFIGKGVGPLLNHLENLKYSKQEKEKLDTICKLNGIRFEIEYFKKRNPFDLEVRVKDVRLIKTGIVR